MGVTGHSPPFAHLTPLTCCVRQYLSIWKYPSARDKMSHYLSAWKRMKNKEMGLQGHPAFKALDALSSQEQIKKLWVCRGKTKKSLETLLKFFKWCKSYSHDEEAQSRISKECSKDFKVSQNLTVPPWSLLSESEINFLDFSVPKLEKGLVRGNWVKQSLLSLLNASPMTEASSLTSDSIMGKT